MELRLVEEQLIAARLPQDGKTLVRRTKAFLVSPGVPTGLGEQGQVVRAVHLRPRLPARGQAVPQELDAPLGFASGGEGPAAQDRRGGGAPAEAVGGGRLEGARRPRLGRGGVAAKLVDD